MMKHSPKLVASLAFLVTAGAASTALAVPFDDPQLDAAYAQLQVAAVNLALLQNAYQQAGDWANSVARAPILALVNNTLGQLNSYEPWINASGVPPTLLTSVTNQVNLATYYTVTDVLSPFQSNGEIPNPVQDAASNLQQFNDALGQIPPGDPGDPGDGDPGDGGWGDPGDGGGDPGGGDPGGGDGDPDDDHC
jgi:hypothetical protein